MRHCDSESEPGAQDIMEMTVESYEDLESDVEVEEYTFDSEFAQIMNESAMLRYDKRREEVEGSREAYWLLAVQ
ncbi:hypothetical protein V1509DRAFT_642537 [Lipomyces kononenkoae]